MYTATLFLSCSPWALRQPQCWSCKAGFCPNPTWIGTSILHRVKSCWAPCQSPGSPLPPPFLSDPHNARTVKSLLERTVGPWTVLVWMCLISCPWPALGEPGARRAAGMVFDQSSWGAQASLLSLLLISSQRAKKGCSPRLSHRYLREQPCQRCEAESGKDSHQSAGSPLFLAWNSPFVRFGLFFKAQNPMGDGTA